MYNFKEIEKKWQKKWKEEKIYNTKEDKSKKKYYILDMFPYPSGDGLHLGHPKGYSATDIFGRLKMMQGYNVLHPMGWDAFGLPAENYALKKKENPKKCIAENIKKFKSQLEKLGCTYDWDREINTTDPNFYKWTQWAFLQMFKRGIAYESFEPIIWCPSCKTGLAMEDLEDGKCERCGSEVIRKPMRQWVLKITKYADRMLKDLDKLPEWEPAIKEMQKNWIGRSEGATVKFEINNSQTNTNLKPTDAENLKKEFLYSDLTYQIRGAIFEVKKNLGLGHKENIYHKALIEEFNKRKIKFESEKQIPVFYNGKKIGTYQPDFIVDNKIIIELKALPEIGKPQTKQIWSYLKGSEYKLALLINFGSKDLSVKRIVYDTARIQNNSAFDRRESATSIEVFTTRPDTLFGCTYLAIAPEHPLISKFSPPSEGVGGEVFQISNFKQVEEYINKTKKKSDLERTDLAKEKTGVKIEGLTAINPVNGKEIPIFVADYVMMGYGSGAIMAVPAHDERDFEFAKKYDLEIIPVINAEIGKYTIIEKSLSPEKFKEIQKIGEQKIIKKDKDWGVFLEISVNQKEEEKLINFLENNLLPSSADGGAWYADSMGSSNIVVFPKKYFEIENREKIKEFQEYGRKLGILEEQLDIDFKCYSDEGINTNSDFLNGLSTKEAKKKMIQWLIKNKLGKKAVNYKLKDWVFSRQRYWGEPIPIIHCPKCGNVAVPEKELPLKLPDVEKYEPTGTGESPLANIEKWVNTTCPKCGGLAKRETNTMPQWAGSSWYYLRYIDPKNNNALIDKEKDKYWSPVDFYVGGAEHATRHLIYARFWHKFLFDIGAVNYPEPFTRLQHVGLVLAEDGRKMSKRWGNVINPDDIINNYGADSLRMYEMFMGPFSQPAAWNMNGLIGIKKFLDRVWKLQEKVQHPPSPPSKVDSKTLPPDRGELARSFGTQPGIKRGYELMSLLHKTIKKVGEDIEEFKFNTAISAMMILVNNIEKENPLTPFHPAQRGKKGELSDSLSLSRRGLGEVYEKLLLILAPFAPHMTEELWSSFTEASEDKEKNKYSQSIFKQSWPKYDPKLIKDETYELVIQVNGKLRDKIEVDANISEEEAKKTALNSEKIKKWIEGKEVMKVIFVKGKLINIVVK